jgi:hypothetical protein
MFSKTLWKVEAGVLLVTTVLSSTNVSAISLFLKGNSGFPNIHEIITPGQPFDTYIEAVNDGSVSDTGTITMLAKDGYSTTNGSFEAANDENENINAGKWVTLETNEETVTSKELIKRIKVAINAPSGIQPGEYFAAITAKDKINLNTASSVALVERIALGLDLLVLGADLKVGNRVLNIESDPREEGKVVLRMVNKGNLFTQTILQANITGPNGYKEEISKLNQDKAEKTFTAIMPITDKEVTAPLGVKTENWKEGYYKIELQTKNKPNHRKVTEKDFTYLVRNQRTTMEFLYKDKKISEQKITSDEVNFEETKPFDYTPIIIAGVVVLALLIVLWVVIRNNRQYKSKNKPAPSSSKINL